MTDPAELVRRFYADVWNRADEDAARTLLDRGFRFRGSLGPERVGPDGFIDYMRSVHAALSGYTCTIEDIVTSTDPASGLGRAAARMRFAGIHRAPFFGIEATGREIVWAGAAFFATGPRTLRSLWVLGDVDAVKQQLGADGSNTLA